MKGMILVNKAYEITKEFLFKTNIYEITSISIEDNYDIDGSNIEGDFIVSGDYRLHEISINKDDFSFKIPFSHEIDKNINLDTIELEITDFSYDFKNGDELTIHLEYTISGELEAIEINDEEELDNFLENNKDAEIVNLSDNSVIKDKDIDKNEDDSNRENSISELLEEYSSSNDIEMPKINTNMNEEKIDHNMFLKNISSDDVFVKYHIHTVVMNDTIESICKKYDVNINTLKKYNTFDNLELNMKLLIPENEEN